MNRVQANEYGRPIFDVEVFWAFQSDTGLP